MKQTLSTKGNTAIEILVALGLVGIVTLVIFSLSQDILKYIQRNHLAATRDQLAMQFRQSAGKIRNLQLSLTKPDNQQFYNCVCGQGAGCTSAQSYDFFLYEPSNPDAPMQTHYDSSGMPCLSTAENCAIEIEIRFISQCLPTLPSSDPTPPPTCVGVPAEFVAISFIVRQNPATLAQGNLFKSISGTVFTQVATLAPAGSGVCP